MLRYFVNWFLIRKFFRGLRRQFGQGQNFRSQGNTTVGSYARADFHSMNRGICLARFLSSPRTTSSSQYEVPDHPTTIQKPKYPAIICDGNRSTRQDLNPRILLPTAFRPSTWNLAEVIRTCRSCHPLRHSGKSSHFLL